MTNLSKEAKELIKLMTSLGYKEEKDRTNLMNKFIGKVLNMSTLPKTKEKYEVIYKEIGKFRKFAKEYRKRI